MKSYCGRERFKNNTYDHAILFLLEFHYTLTAIIIFLNQKVNDIWLLITFLNAFDDKIYIFIYKKKKCRTFPLWGMILRSGGGWTSAGERAVWPNKRHLPCNLWSYATGACCYTEYWHLGTCWKIGCIVFASVWALLILVYC